MQFYIRMKVNDAIGTPMIFQIILEILNWLDMIY